MPSVCNAGNDHKGFQQGYDSECFVEAVGNDAFWFCGPKKNYCASIEVWQKNQVYEKHHGQSFSHKPLGRDNTNTGGGTFWCCGGTSTEHGKFVNGSTWIKSTTSVTKTVKDVYGNPLGNCTWAQKTNVCGEIDNPEDECFEPTSECANGYVSRNNGCAPICKDGYAFASETSATCIPCEETGSQGIVKSTCVKCASNEVFDKDAGACVSKADKLVITPMAHEECWLCTSTSALKSCLRLVSSGGYLNSDASLRSQCSLNSKR